MDYMKRKYIISIVGTLVSIGVVLFLYFVYIQSNEETSEYDDINVDQILGTWKVITKSGQAINYSLKYTFYENLTYLSEINFTKEQLDYYGENYTRLYNYKIENNVVYLYFDIFDNPDSTNYMDFYAKFSDDGNTLGLYMRDASIFNTVMKRV